VQTLIQYIAALKENSAAISAITALIAVIVGPLVSYLIAKKSIHSNIVISNRIKRLEAVRDELGQFCALYNRNINCIEQLHAAHTEDVRKKLNLELDELGTALSSLRISISLKIDYRSGNQQRLARMLNDTISELDRYTVMPGLQIDIRPFVAEAGNLMLTIIDQEDDRARRLR
jgi:hypothetical protein